jgi:hypothetical protein
MCAEGGKTHCSVLRQAGSCWQKCVVWQRRVKQTAMEGERV